MWELHFVLFNNWLRIMYIILPLSLSRRENLPVFVVCGVGFKLQICNFTEQLGGVKLMMHCSITQQQSYATVVDLLII
jgi:hypothetical protein